MKRKTVIRYLLSGILGGFLGFLGFTFLTYQFWVIMLIFSGVLLNEIQDAQKNI